ncbi:hypothetical protein VKT23_015357 [Stygiomarasmius scandens]|uniref:Uncharacterized protein n=1 Tax=Marasmiellus scandens TaxID=2682957 RepID=A0ABR1IY43_9AGAR
MSGSDERINTMITVLPVSSALEASSSSSSNKNGGTRKRVFLVFGGVLSPSHREFGRKMFRKLEEWLHEDGPGRIQPNRYTELVSTYDTKADGSSPVELGLARIPEGLERLKKG